MSASTVLFFFYDTIRVWRFMTDSGTTRRASRDEEWASHAADLLGRWNAVFLARNTANMEQLIWYIA